MKNTPDILTKNLSITALFLLLSLWSMSQITTFPYQENFNSWKVNTISTRHIDDGTVTLQSGWRNFIGDDFDWNVNSGPTKTSKTGPSAGIDRIGNYLFVESSSCYSKTASIIMPLFDFSYVNNPTLSFYYYMFGSNMGFLSIEVSTDKGKTWSQSIWSLEGTQTNNWNKAIVSLKEYSHNSSVSIRFTAITGSGKRSDIAIDNIIVAPKYPSNIQAKNITPNSMELFWTENADATTWDIEYGLKGFTLGTGVLIKVKDSNFIKITGLLDYTSYDFYIRSNYIDKIKSSFSSPITITTQADLQSRIFTKQ